MKGPSDSSRATVTLAIQNSINTSQKLLSKFEQLNAFQIFQSKLELRSDGADNAAETTLIYPDYCVTIRLFQYRFSSQMAKAALSEPSLFQKKQSL